MKSNTLLICIYLFTRIVVANIFNFSSVSQNINIGLIINLALYTLCILLIINNRSNLLYFNINKTTVIILIISGFFPRITSNSVISVIIQLLFIIIAIWLWVIYRKKELSTENLPKMNYWSIIGIILLIPLLFILSKLRIYLPLSVSPNNSSVLASFPPITYIYYLCYVGFEETVFRGFLWGYLRGYKINEIKILFITSGIFWISHLNYLSHPWTFWIQLPIISLYLGLLAYKSKMASPSIFAHAFYNTFLAFIKG